MIVNLTDVKTVLLDMDGVLWRGEEPVINAQQLFERIITNGLKVFCITNNSARTIEYYLEKLGKLGVNLNRDQIISSAEAASLYLEKKFPQGGRVYVVGEEGLIETLHRRNFTHVVDPDLENILAVVAGLDRNLTYQKIAIATHLISSGIPLIGTNPDKSIPVANGIAPGAGSIISAIEVASGTKAIIIGKPESYIFQLALDMAKCDPREAIMIGDRLDTDMLGAQRIGIHTGLVLSGVTDRTQAENWNPALTIIAENAVEIVDEII